MLFPVAFDTWISHRIIESNGLRTRASYIAAKTERDYRVCARALEKYFAKMRLGEIHPGHVMDYQNARASNRPHAEGSWRCLVPGRWRKETVRASFETREQAEEWARVNGDSVRITQTLWAYAAGANCIRKEIALLIRIQRAARLWGDLEEQAILRVRPQEPDVRRALTAEEQHRLLHVASSRLEWQFIHNYIIVALQTTASTNEMRSLRLGDVYIDDRILQVPRQGAKNKYRMRDIPLVTEDAVRAMKGLVARARSLGSSGPADYLFPIQARRGEYDPHRPMSESGLKKAWDAVRKASNLPHLRIYDLRHTGITRMAEAGVPLRVVMNFAGHMTERMQQRYEAMCMSAKRGWGEQVWGPPVRPAEDGPAAPIAAPSMAAWPARKPVVSETVTRAIPAHGRMG
ncbi:MAG TPA: tyrosine-type recombinase/integrase [Bryobacteraceae bacterium]|nr:tyrosine-type recombinase/integrase [Bryobacteraceae bacterium]